MIRIVAEGTWLYGGTVPSPVRIIETDYDFWFEIGEADGDLEPDEVERLNDSGHVYYAYFQPGEVPTPFWPDSIGNMSMVEAKVTAAARLPSDIMWK